MTVCVRGIVSESVCRCSASIAPEYDWAVGSEAIWLDYKPALSILRLWPVDEETAAQFAEVFRELRAAGRMLSQFDLLIAAVARQYRLVVLTADRDFRYVGRLRTENWL
jgi:predicted nucleic acid-binding protein